MLAASPAASITKKTKRPGPLTRTAEPLFSPETVLRVPIKLMLVPPRLLFRQHILQSLNHLLRREAFGAGASHNIAHNSIQFPLALCVVLLHTLNTDESARSLMRIQEAANFELSVGADHRVGI